MIRYVFFLCSLFLYNISVAQSQFTFAQISDLHIGSNNADEDLRRTVQDINQQNEIKFVVATGDITEFGSDKELLLAKQILDSLNKPWYIIPGNHDDNWSESGTNSFIRIFGKETFAFNYDGFYFMGTNCGPNMKMSPGQVPYENIVWTDSVLQHIPKNAPVIFVNHYPLDSSLNNWYDVVDRLKKYNTQLYMCGHGHQNKTFDFEGIPGVMGRSNLRAKDSIGGYNIVTIHNNKAIYNVRIPDVQTKPSWATIALYNHHYTKDTTHYFRPSYAVNESYPFVKEAWRYQDASDIGSGFVLYKKTIIIPDSKGRVLAIDPATKKIKWQFHAAGKIYTTPAIQNDKLIISATDGNIYCLNADNGNLRWKFVTSKSIVASPAIYNSAVYVGSSEGLFRCIDLNTGKLRWTFDSVKNFVKSVPVYYQNKIYFGGWGNEFYCVNADDGTLVWKYNDGYTNRMLSPASCLPVIVKNKLFIVAPDRYMTALDANTGTVIWKHRWNDQWVRESIGVSVDSTLIYAKTMQGRLIGVSTESNMPEIKWQTPLVFGYELNPSVIKEENGIVYAVGDKGLIGAFDRNIGNIIWLHKVSNSLINDIQFMANDSPVVTTMDGKVVVLKVK